MKGTKAHSTPNCSNICHYLIGDSNSRTRKESTPLFQPDSKVIVQYNASSLGFDWKAISLNPNSRHTPIVSLALFRMQYTQTIEQIRAAQATPVLLTLPSILPQRHLDYVSRGLNKANILSWMGGDVSNLSALNELYNQEILQIGKDLNVQVIDISNLLLDRRSMGDFYNIDGIRPNREGQALIEEILRAS